MRRIRFTSTRIRARAAEIEAGRQLPADLVLELANARLFKVALPESEGGLGADVLTALRVIEEVARADGSTGWCVAMGINTFRQSAQLAPEVRRELFFGDPIGVSAGSARERGRAVAVPGGYRVTGHWFFASGCMHSRLLHGACKVFDGDTPRLRPNGDQEIRIAFFFPRSRRGSSTTGTSAACAAPAATTSPSRISSCPRSAPSRPSTCARG